MAETWPYEVKWDVVDAHFKAPPELLQPLPRRVEAREKGLSGRERMEMGCLSGCLAPLFVLGVLMALWGGLTALILPLGSPATGVVFERERGNGRDSTYGLKFRFRANGSVYRGEGLVPTERWKQAQVGTTVRVRYFPFAPGLRPIIEDGTSPWVAILVMGPLGILIACVGGVPLLSLVTRRSGKKWVRRGIVAPAFVVKRDDARGTLTFLVRDENGRAWEVESRPKNLAHHYAGQTEVALYFPDKPMSARLYRWLDWKGKAT